MDDNLSWTTELGQAFLNQQAEVMKSVQRLRASASKLGNLQSSPQQQVVADAGNIEIVPADPQLIYVPVYQPAQVYYDAAVGLPFISFGFGWPIGPWLGYDCDWGNGGLIFWGPGYSRPFNWWHQSSRERGVGRGSVWRPGNHPGAFAAGRGDRGWSGNSMPRSAAPAVRGSGSARAAPSRAGASMSASRASVGRTAASSRPASSGAFIGVHSASITRSYSSRGRQSVQQARPSASGGSRGGGGGSRGGGGRR
jgi:hypothetical protein